ncbi:MAG: hypothetical protein ACWGQW_25155, partial [bacterium]
MRGLARTVLLLHLGLGLLLLIACSSPEDSSQTDSTNVDEAGEPTAAELDNTPQPTNLPTPGPTQQPTSDAAVKSDLAETSAYAEILSYMPSFYADMHIPTTFGPPLFLLDVEQIRHDLGIGPITGSSDYQEKTGLVIALNEKTQGLSAAFPSIFFPTTSNSFEEWGWDFTDVDSVLNLRGDGLTIMSGDFSRPTIMQNLGEEGVELPGLGPFLLYRIDETGMILAVKPDTMIVSTNPSAFAQDDPDMREEFVRMMIETNLTGAGLENHPVIKQLLSEISESWGILLSPSPDLVEWSNQLAGPLETLGDRKLPDAVL